MVTVLIDEQLTVSAGTRLVITPNINDCAMVNMPKNMKLVGDTRRTLSQQANAIIVTSKTTIATKNNSGCLLKNSLVPS